MTVGPYTITLLETGRFGLDGGAMFGVVPRTMWEKAYSIPDDRNRIPMAAKVLLIRGNGKVILVDTGNTTLMTPKLAEIYKLDFGTYTLAGELLNVGVEAGDVTDVILTHLHFDHAGGLTIANENGTVIPQFPNAKVHVQKDHYAWALAPKEKDRASFVEETWKCIAENGMLNLVDGPGELFPHIHVDCVHGHTQALQTVRVGTGSTNVFFPADLVPTSAHISVPFVMGYDNFPLTAIEEKKRILPIAAEERWIVVFGHDALRDAGYLTLGTKGAQLAEEVDLRGERP